ncbi:F-type H+-transporting ATPase subunit gamma [Lewinella marina]|uniref:ATP synthase gamma chain n=1 Tax=Neolewinella marina TaxID=438751 RepID=A0A2G0CIA0_9BACT|nr:ATP synthase F1 subunit gamma [Neolewinella marina]NJB85164.1 F-type H+-transporting ATPase subunit gamma [Neolewinella marina]PHK99703.1 ATP synthase F1 subunit gamma [Neolewinella marina]
MANLKEVRERIRSVKNTQQITSAMKMVSAAKLRRAQQAITELRPYADKLDEMLRNILTNLEGDANTTFNKVRPVEGAAVVVVTSNRGLAGAFNTNVIKAAEASIREMGPLSGPLDIICIGRKGAEYFRKHYGKRENVKVVTDFQTLFDDLSFDNTREVPELLMNRFRSGRYDKVFIAYARFKNAAVQFATSEQFLPVEDATPDPSAEAATGTKYKADYIFEPGKEELLDYLVPSILETKFQAALLDTHASEHGARMTAMDKATENAQELLRELKISYNKARQEAITNEILEIVGGAAALEAS